MKNFPFNITSFGFAILLILVTLNSCQFIPFLNEEPPALQTEASSALKDIQVIYIQSFTGDNIIQFQNKFLSSLKTIKKFKISELLPDGLDNLGVLRIKVNDFTIWENSELVNPFTDLGEFDVSADTNFIRRNALVNVHISLYEAKTGKILIQKYFSQPFQQIFLGEEEVENKISKEDELIRLTALLSDKVIDALLEVKTEEKSLNLREGFGYDLISGTFFDFGDWRIRKGNKFAEARNYEQAIEVWKIVLFEPGKNEPEQIYIKNKADAFYNLGAVFLRQKKWLEAADMFSNANRIHRKVEYAQAWGDSIQSWLSEKQKSSQISNEPPEETQSRLDENQESMETTDKPAVQKLNLVYHEDLLLKPLKLWPLEPLIKDKFDDGQIPIGNELNQ